MASRGRGIYGSRKTCTCANTSPGAFIECRYEGSAELFAEELRLAQEALNTITGEFSSDDLLGEIFSRFCIGK